MSRMTDAERRFIKLLGIVVVVSGLAFALILRTTSQQLLDTLAEGKPGLWGQPTWYLLLLSGYGTSVLAVLVGVVSMAFGKQGAALYKWYALTLLATVLARGLFYSSMAPPWQSPDEHAHFEYAALLGQLKRPPSLDDLSPALQKQIVHSMFEHDFWRLIKRAPVESAPEGFLLQDGVTEVPPTHVVDNRFLYYPQVETDPPLYYIAPAVAYVTTRQLDVALQLYTMRLSTVAMLVALIGAIVWATRRLFPRNLPLAVGIPTLIAFHPMLAHIGSVLNNEILAAVMTSLLLGVLVVTIRSGVDWRRVVTLGVLSTLGMLTKVNTAWTIPLLGGAGLVLGSQRHRWMRYVMLILAIGLLLFSVSLFIPSQQARHWRPASAPWGATVAGRASQDGAPALRVEGAATEDGVLAQQLLRQTVLDLRGQSIILSAKARTQSGESQGELALSHPDDGINVSTDFTASPEGHDVLLRFTVPDDALELEVQLIAEPQSVIYFEQVKIRSESAEEGPTTGVRNSSGEKRRKMGEIALVELTKRVGLGGVVQRFFDLGSENLRKIVSDPRPVQLAFESFWGNFGAALAVPLPSLAYRILKYACGLSILGLGVFVWNIRASKSSWEVWQLQALSTLAMALVFGLLLLFAPLLALYGFWSPQGRYLFPVVWPIGVLLTLGWLQLAPRHKRAWLLLPLTVGIITLDCVALQALFAYFYL